jgi:hypothetical protein
MGFYFNPFRENREGFFVKNRKGITPAGLKAGHLNGKYVLNRSSRLLPRHLTKTNKGKMPCIY